MSQRFERSASHHDRAKRHLAGGVATAFRATQLPVPICFVGGEGAWLEDLDGCRYVDWALGYGPMLLGHSPEPVLDAAGRQLRRGLGYGACHQLEADLAEAVCRTVPSAELCVFNSTGSEAVHAALRIARASTGRNRVIKFQGHYHGWLDPLHVGVGASTDAGPGTAGQDPGASAAVTVCRWDDLPALEAVMGEDVAAVIMEPVAVNGGCFLPSTGYLAQVRKLVDEAGALLVFDEVITGYRLALGGAQELLGVAPDLTVLGKALGGGLPISAVCGRAEVMAEVAAGRVAHVGTFNANPVCASAALAAVTELERRADEIYPQLNRIGEDLAAAITAEAVDADLSLRVNQVGGIAHAFVAPHPVTGHEQARTTDFTTYRKFAAALLDEGVHVIPRGLLYVSAAHGQEEVALTRRATAAAARRVVSDMARQA
ncbi:MAG: aspartate aminotransferase family protein [Acidimicrobiales bacterium]